MRIIGTIKWHKPSGAYGYIEVDRKVGECDRCGSKVELLGHTNRCQCGQRYNLFGQAVMESELG